MYDLSENMICPEVPGFLPVQDFVAKRNSSLPDMTYILVDEWLDGSGTGGKIEIPESGHPYYDITVTVGEVVSLTSYVAYDFVSTDILLELHDSNGDIVGKSEWDLADDTEEFNFLSSVEAVRLQPGVYTLRIVFNDAIKTIFDILPDIKRARCAFFDFNIETEVIKATNVNLNTLVGVEPSQRNSLDVSHTLTIIATFAGELSKEKSDIENVIVLIDDENVAAKPSKINLEKKSNRKLKALFLPESL
jgi:hypothetical protein